MSCSQDFVSPGVPAAYRKFYYVVIHLHKKKSSKVTKSTWSDNLDIILEHLLFISLSPAGLLSFSSSSVWLLLPQQSYFSSHSSLSLLLTICVSFSPSLSLHRNVSDPRGQGLGRRPRRRHGHHQRRGRPLRSRGQEGVLHLDRGRSGGGGGKDGGRWGEERSEEKKKPPFVFTTLQFFTQLEGWWEGTGGKELQAG